MDPLVSIVIPTYERANIIPISLSSVLCQTHQNLEIIVVDDCSRDNTEQVVKSFNDPRIHFLQHSCNRRGAAARNTGIDAATGEYIAFLDSDDAWVSDKVEKQLKHIRESCTPQQVVSYTQVFYSKSGITKETYDSFDQNFFMPKQAKLPNESIAEYLFCREGKTLTSTLMMHRSLASKTRFREDFKKHQDWDFCIRLEAGGARFSFIPEPLTIWNGDPSFSHVGQLSDYVFSEKWLTECEKYISDNAKTAFYLKKILPYLTNKKEKKVFCQQIIIKAFIQGQIGIKPFLKKTRKVWL